MSPLGHRLVAALLGAAVVWRVVNGVGALVRWLWLGDRLGNGPMSLFLVAVVVAPVVGAVSGDAAVRRGVWSTGRRATRRRGETLLAVVVLPVLANAVLRAVLPVQHLSLPLQGVTTLTLVGGVVLVECRYGPFSGEDE